MPGKLVTAFFKSVDNSAQIDREAGVLRGVKLMQLGKLSKFKAGDGKSRSVTITNDHISALLQHAGNRSIPIHLTHDWMHGAKGVNANTLEMNARIGAHKNIRLADNGDLISDAHFKPSVIDDIAWGAEHDPQDNCFSVVYDMLPEDQNCIPQNFRAGDLVPAGAATTATFESDMPDNPENNTPADILTQIAEIAKDPAKRAALKALLKEIEKGDAPDTDTPDDDAGAVAAMSLNAGVTDADKKPEDAKFRPLVACAMQCERARTRKLSETTAAFEKAKADILVAAQAKATEMQGNNRVEAGKANMTTALFGFDKVKAYTAAQLAKQQN